MTDKLAFHRWGKLEFKKLIGDIYEINLYIQFISTIQYVIFIFSLFFPLELMESHLFQTPILKFWRYLQLNYPFYM